MSSVLTIDVSELRGISGKRKDLLAKLDIYNLGDLLWHLPRSYENYALTPDPDKATDGEIVTIKAVVATSPTLFRRGRLSYLNVTLTSEYRNFKAVWFNQPWLQNKLQRGEEFLFHGQIKKKGVSFELLNPEIIITNADLPSFQPVYALTAGISKNTLRGYVSQALKRVQNSKFPIAEILPEELILAKGWPCFLDAIETMHFPKGADALQKARARLVFEELLLFATGIRAANNQEQTNAFKLNFDEQLQHKLQEAEQKFTFALTAGQKKVLREIYCDLSADQPMNRLLEGDVGSGKTVVAFLTMLAVCFSGYQAAFMAPTAILAEQHYQKLRCLAEAFGLKVLLLTGKMSAKERENYQKQIFNGEADMVIGTHALLSEELKFSNLALLVTDEQHRFGVRQRLKLAVSATKTPHLLVMSATPIPRSLALIFYGDLAISELTDMPQGRNPIKTYTAHYKDVMRIRNIMQQEISQGHTVYVVCPNITESEMAGLHAAEAVFADLKQSFPSYRVRLLHGRLKAQEKSQITEALRRGQIDILVATTVIEVGIDYPLANLMIIHNAERFGMAQLHQLRGRVGRSDLEAMCIFISDTTDKTARQRLVSVCKNQSGFDIAKDDLNIRGPGDFFGVRQSGLPEFKIADLTRDRDIMLEAVALATKIVKEDPNFTEPRHEALQKAFKERYNFMTDSVFLN